jgi:hypothetical protein
MTDLALTLSYSLPSAHVNSGGCGSQQAAVVIAWPCLRRLRRNPSGIADLDAWPLDLRQDLTILLQN